MPVKRHILISASIRPRTGKTLLARLLAGHVALAEGKRILFDTDDTERRLAAYFPGETTVINLDRVPDQMKLFDTVSSRPEASQVIDLTHRSFAKFFQLMQDTGYVTEAKAAGLEPVIFFIPDGSAESFDQAFTLRERFKDCGFVLVHNAAVAEPGREAMNSRGMIGLSGHKPVIRLPLLDPFFASAIDDEQLSLSDFVRQTAQRDVPGSLQPGRLSLAFLSLEARHGISAWLQGAFAEIRRALQYTDIQAEIIAHERFGA